MGGEQSVATMCFTGDRSGARLCSGANLGAREAARGGHVWMGLRLAAALGLEAAELSGNAGLRFAAQDVSRSVHEVAVSCVASLAGGREGEQEQEQDLLETGLARTVVLTLHSLPSGTDIAALWLVMAPEGHRDKRAPRGELLGVLSSAPCPEATECFSAVHRFAVGAVELLAVACVDPVTEQSRVKLFVVRPAQPRAAGRDEHCRTKEQEQEQGQGEAKPPLIMELLTTLESPDASDQVVRFASSGATLVCATSSGAAVAWHMENARDAAAPVARIVFESDLGAPPVRLVLRPPPASSGGKGLRVPNRGLLDLLTLCESGRLRVTRFSWKRGGGETEPSTIVDIDVQAIASRRWALFNLCEVAETPSASRPSPPATQPACAHAFSLVFAAGVDTEQQSCVCLLDLRRLQDPEGALLRVLQPPAGASLRLLHFGPFLNGPLVYIMENGVVRISDTHGIVMRSDYGLAGCCVAGVLPTQEGRSLLLLTTQGRALRLAC